MMTSRKRKNIGFDGRTFLTEAEWLTYLRRKPVRYIKKEKAAICEVCGEPPNGEDTLQNAHKIGFDLGVIRLALTPEFLDKHENISTAHKKKCNRKVELDIEDAIRQLMTSGITSLPEFLPKESHDHWNQVLQSAV